MPARRVRITALYLIVLSLALLGTSAFTKPPIQCKRVESHRFTKQSDVGLQMANIFDDIRNFFDEFGNVDKKESEVLQDLSAGMNRVTTIPVREIKPGGLRLFLMFHLIGKQNTPEKGSWWADQPMTTADEYILDLRFHDRSAALTVTLHPDQITIDRVGSAPSTAYMMQEGVIIQSVLDELHECAFDDAIEVENRLLILPEPQDAIDKARDVLAFA
jgi:hypothetical protein